MGVRQYFESIASTQEVAIELARGGASPGTRVVARSQSAGRGRGEHRWHSPEGALLLSVVSGEIPDGGGLLPVVLGASIALRLNERYGVTTGVRWPNDVVTAGTYGRGQKLGGVLVDRVASRAGIATVVGVGINVVCRRESFPAELRDSVAILAELTSRRVSVEGLEDDVVGCIDGLARDFEAESGRRQWLERARGVLFAKGRRASVDGRYRGVIRGLGPAGELELDSDGELLSLRSGTLTIEEAA